MHAKANRAGGSSGWVISLRYVFFFFSFPTLTSSPRLLSLPDNLLSFLIKSDTSVRFLLVSGNSRPVCNGKSQRFHVSVILHARRISPASAPPLGPALWERSSVPLLFITGAYCKSLLVPLFWFGERKGQHCQGEIDLNGKANFFFGLLFQGVYFGRLLSALCRSSQRSNGQIYRRPGPAKNMSSPL